MAEAVGVAGQSAKVAGLSFEQLSAIVAKTMESTRQEGSQIGNALKTIFTRLSKASKLAGDEVDTATLSQASKALHEIGIEVYTTTGEYREFDVILSELSKKWDDLTDAQKSNLSYQIAATRQSNTLQSILKNYDASMDLAEDATETSGNAMANQEKYLNSYGGKLQQISTQMDTFWLKFYNSDVTKGVLDFLIEATKLFNKLADTISPIGALLTATVGVITGVSVAKNKGGGRNKHIKKYKCIPRNNMPPKYLSVRRTSCMFVCSCKHIRALPLYER